MSDRRKYVIDVPLGDGHYMRLVESTEPQHIAECVRILLTCNTKRPQHIHVYSELIAVETV